MIIWMNNRLVPPLTTEKLNSAVRDDFVHVHVRRGTATCMEDINHELVVESPLHNLLRRRNNGLALLWVQQSQLHVGPRSRELDQSHSPNEFLRKAMTRYGKVLNRPLGLSAIIRRARDFDLPHGVLVQPIFLDRNHYRHAGDSRENWD